MRTGIRVLVVLVLTTSYLFLALATTHAQAKRPTEANQQQDLATQGGKTKPKLEVIVIRPPNHIPKPGSPEEAFLKQQVELAEQGKIKVLRLGSSEPPPAPVSTGTSVSAGQLSGRSTLPIEHEFCKVMKEKDPLPPARAQHFSWLSKVPETRQSGWSGIVMESQAQANNTWLIKVRVSPCLWLGNKRRWAADFIQEVYLFDGENVRLVESDAAVPQPKLQHFDF